MTPAGDVLLARCARGFHRPNAAGFDLNDKVITLIIDRPAQSEFIRLRFGGLIDDGRRLPRRRTDHLVELDVIGIDGAIREVGSFASAGLLQSDANVPSRSYFSKISLTVAACADEAAEIITAAAATASATRGKHPSLKLLAFVLKLIRVAAHRS